MTTLEIILSCITALFGGGNILQLFVMRSIKRKSMEEANQATSESWRLIVEGNVKEIKRLQERVEYFETKYNELLDEINVLKQRIADDETNYNNTSHADTGRLQDKKKHNNTRKHHDDNSDERPSSVAD